MKPKPISVDTQTQRVKLCKTHNLSGWKGISLMHISLLLKRVKFMNTYGKNAPVNSSKNKFKFFCFVLFSCWYFTSRFTSSRAARMWHLRLKTQKQNFSEVYRFMYDVRTYAKIINNNRGKRQQRGAQKEQQNWIHKSRKWNANRSRFLSICEERKIQNQ